MLLGQLLQQIELAAEHEIEAAAAPFADGIADERRGQLIDRFYELRRHAQRARVGGVRAERVEHLVELVEAGRRQRRLEAARRDFGLRRIHHARSCARKTNPKTMTASAR
jgi:hypothetical protein